MKKGPLYISHSIFIVVKAADFLIPASIPTFSSLRSEQFCCPAPKVSGDVSWQAGNQGNVGVTILQPCTRETQIRQPAA